MKKFQVVAVIYNNYKDTFEFCQSLKRANSSRFYLSCFLVDNSDDFLIKELIDTIQDDFDFVRILRPSRNIGYFGAFNFFFESEFFESEAVVLICNNDLIFSADFFEALYRAKYNEDVFVICPDVLTFDGVHQNPHVLKPRTWLQRIKLDLYFSSYYIAFILRFIQRIIKPLTSCKTGSDLALPGYLHMGIGACYVLLPKFFAKFNRLNYPHFLYGEEAYLTNQVHSEGGRLYYDPKLKILHKEGATLSKLPGRTTYNFGRDGYWSYRKFY